MEYFLGQLIAVDGIDKLNLAAGAICHHDVCPGGLDVIRFSIRDFLGQVVKVDAESSRHAAATVRIWQLDVFNIWDGL